MITIVIPARNEEATIGEVIRNIQIYVKEPYELFVIDDASTDKTVEIARGLGAKVIQHSIQRGGIFVDDFEVVKGKHIISLDADMEHHPKDIPRFISALEQHDFVLGERGFRSCAMERILQFFFKLPASDPFTGFVGFRRKWIHFIVRHKMRIWAETPLLIDAAGGKIGSVRITDLPNIRPSRFGGALKGNWKMLLFFLRCWRHAKMFKKGKCGHC